MKNTDERFPLNENQNANPVIYSKKNGSDYSTEEEDDDEIEISISTANEAKQIQTKMANQNIPSINMMPKSSVVLTAAFSNSVIKPSDIDDTSLATNYPIFEHDIDKGEKPWKKPGSDISDYFNYGFNEETWKIYCEKQRRLRIEAASMRRVYGDNPGVVSTDAIVQSDLNINQQKPQDSPIPNPMMPLNIPMNMMPTNLPFQMPPGMNLNLPPEFANSIANLAASSLGLPASFLSQLSSMPNLMPQNLNTQSLFPGMFGGFQPPPPPSTEIPFPIAPVDITNEPKKETPHISTDIEPYPPKQIDRKSSPEHHTSRSTRNREKREEDRHRESRRHRDRRSRSREKPHRDRKKR